jgi:hypothetical protein
MGRKTAAYYSKHPNAKYWRSKGDKLWSEIIRAQRGCVLCNSANAQAHHILTKGSYPQCRHEIQNGIPVCYQHHIGQKRGLISAHGSPMAFMDWLKKNRRWQWEWIQAARKADTPRKLTWKESYENLLRIKNG